MSTLSLDNTCENYAIQASLAIQTEIPQTPETSLQGHINHQIEPTSKSDNESEKPLTPTNQCSKDSGAREDEQNNECSTLGTDEPVNSWNDIEPCHKNQIEEKQGSQRLETDIVKSLAHNFFEIVNQASARWKKIFEDQCCAFSKPKIEENEIEKEHLLGHEHNEHEDGGLTGEGKGICSNEHHFAFVQDNEHMQENCHNIH